MSSLPLSTSPPNPSTLAGLNLAQQYMDASGNAIRSGHSNKSDEESSSAIGNDIDKTANPIDEPDIIKQNVSFISDSDTIEPALSKSTITPHSRNTKFASSSNSSDPASSTISESSEGSTDEEQSDDSQDPGKEASVKTKPTNSNLDAQYDFYYRTEITSDIIGTLIKTMEKKGINEVTPELRLLLVNSLKIKHLIPSK